MADDLTCYATSFQTYRYALTEPHQETKSILELQLSATILNELHEDHSWSLTNHFGVVCSCQTTGGNTPEHCNASSQ